MSTREARAAYAFVQQDGLNILDRYTTEKLKGLMGFTELSKAERLERIDLTLQHLAACDEIKARITLLANEVKPDA